MSAPVLKLPAPIGIYPVGSEPNFGVYSADSLAQWGERAVAQYHFWTRTAAEAAATHSTDALGREYVVIEYAKAKEQP